MEHPSDTQTIRDLLAVSFWTFYDAIRSGGRKSVYGSFEALPSSASVNSPSTSPLGPVMQS